MTGGLQGAGSYRWIDIPRNGLPVSVYREAE